MKKLCLLIALAVGLSACSTTHQDSQAVKEANLTIEKNLADISRSAKKSFLEGRYNDAARSYHAALQRDPFAHEARLGLAESYLKLGNNTEALANFTMLLDIPDYRASGFQGIGLAALQEGDHAKSEDALQTAVSLDATLWRAWNGLARFYDTEQEWGLANEAYENALRHTNRPEVIYNNMGVSLMTQEKFSEAAKAFQEALAHKPDLDVASTNYQLALAMQSRYDEATLTDQEAGEAKALNNAGYAAMLKKDYNEAEKLFLKAIEVNPSFYRPAYENLQVLYHLRDGNG